MVTTMGTAVLCSLHVWLYLSAAAVTDGKGEDVEKDVTDVEQGVNLRQSPPISPLPPTTWKLGCNKNPAPWRVFPMFLHTDPSFFPSSFTST